jgi:hypothetical protein
MEELIQEQKSCTRCLYFEMRKDGVYQCQKGVIDHDNPFHENRDTFFCSKFKQSGHILK